MTEYFTSIAGNASLRRRLAEEILAGKFPHAYIIEGIQGSGRKTLAKNAAAALSCVNKDKGKLPCLICPACRKILDSKTPDIIHIAPERGRVTIGVETARGLRRDVMTVPNDFDYKVYIIEDADKMTPQAQNALLLTLENPPKYAMFFLICQSSAALLETVRSRAPILRTEPLPPEMIHDYITAHDSRAAELASESPGELSELIAAAGGSIGAALALLDAKARRPVIERRRIAKDFIMALSHGFSSPSSLSALSLFSKKREEATAELLLVSDALRDLIVLKKSENAPLIFFFDSEEALDISDKFTLPRLFALSERISSAIELLGRNANLRLTLINLIGAGIS